MKERVNQRAIMVKMLDWNAMLEADQFWYGTLAAFIENENSGV